MVTGRGAWPVSGLGGTKKFRDATKPGPYYYLGSGQVDGERDVNEYAVYGAVKAYQRTLNRRIGARLQVTGVFDAKTEAALVKFQNTLTDVTPWGGIGPDTSREMLMPDLRRIWKEAGVKGLPVEVVSGTVRHESNWDVGAVGFIDSRDLGLAQINAAAHPELSADVRLQPIDSFEFVIAYYRNTLDVFKGNLRDAVASYNLGVGGTNSWIKAGRPDTWTPAGSTDARNVKEYIDDILKG